MIEQNNLIKGMGQFNLRQFISNLQSEQNRIDDDNAHRGGDIALTVESRTIGTIIEALEWYTSSMSHLPRL